MIVKHFTLTFIFTCCRLTLIYCPYFYIVLYQISDCEICTALNNNVVAKYIVVSNIISVASEYLAYIYPGTPLQIS